MEGEVQGLGTESISEAPVQSSAPTEKMLRQSEVNDIVGRAKQEAASRAVEQYRRQQESNSQSQYQQAPDAQRSASYSESDYRRIAAEEIQRSREEWLAQAKTSYEADTAKKVVDQFYNKIESGKSKYEDFDKMTGDIDLGRFPNVVQLLAEHIDNSGDVLYELGRDRLKMAQLEQLANLSPKDAIIQAQRLAQSIKDNEVARGARTPNAPLSQQRASTLGAEAGGALSLRELKMKYRG